MSLRKVSTWKLARDCRSVRGGLWRRYEARAFDGCMEGKLQAWVRTQRGTQEVVFPAQVEHESFKSPPGTPNILLPTDSRGLPQLEDREGRPKRKPHENLDKGKLLVLTPQGSSFHCICHTQLVI